MTSSALIQAAANMRTAPSREFMVQQAVLDTIAYMHPFYSKAWCAGLNENYMPVPFVRAVREQYRRVAAQYSVSP